MSAKSWPGRGLRRHDNGIELYMMVGVPSNVILLAEFAEYFDGFSIGSNDLTQLTLGVDRDSEIVAHVFDERDQAVRALIAPSDRAGATARTQDWPLPARRRAITPSLRGSSSSAVSTACRSIRTPCCQPVASCSRPNPASRPRCRSLRMRSSDGAALADDPSPLHGSARSSTSRTFRRAVAR